LKELAPLSTHQWLAGK